MAADGDILLLVDVVDDECAQEIYHCHRHWRREGGRERKTKCASTKCEEDLFCLIEWRSFFLYFFPFHSMVPVTKGIAWQICQVSELRKIKAYLRRYFCLTLPGCCLAKHAKPLEWCGSIFSLFWPNLWCKIESKSCQNQIASFQRSRVWWSLLILQSYV